MLRFMPRKPDFGSPGHFLLDRSLLRRNPAEEGALTAGGRLLVHPAAFWAQFNQTEITHFCVTHGFYCIPTAELVGWLTEMIGGRTAIEIGSGCGVLATALGIPATDSRQQESPEMARYYTQVLGVATITYGENVHHLDAATAVATFKPEVVIGAWITHKYNEAESWRGGNMLGVDEIEIIRQTSYIHIGHTRIHGAKPALEHTHKEYYPPWLVSRAISEGTNYICSWWGA